MSMCPVFPSPAHMQVMTYVSTSGVAYLIDDLIGGLLVKRPTNPRDIISLALHELRQVCALFTGSLAGSLLVRQRWSLSAGIGFMCGSRFLVQEEDLFKGSAYDEHKVVPPYQVCW